MIPAGHPHCLGRDPANGQSEHGQRLSSFSDVAVLQLADDGHELPDELPLATREKELYDIFAQPVGMLGYPGHDTGNFPAGQTAGATFARGLSVAAGRFFQRHRQYARAAVSTALDGQLVRLQRLANFSPQRPCGRAITPARRSVPTACQRISLGASAIVFIGNFSKPTSYSTKLVASRSGLGRHRSIFSARSANGATPKGESTAGRRPR